MKCVEGISAGVRTEATGYFLFDLEFAYSPLGAVVVRWYCRILKEVEDIVPASDDSPFQFVELFAHLLSTGKCNIRGKAPVCLLGEVWRETRALSCRRGGVPSQ